VLGTSWFRNQLVPHGREPVKSSRARQAGLCAATLFNELLPIEVLRRRAADQFWRSMNGKQGGDPAKLAQALLAIAAMTSPPLRFIAGAIAGAEQKVALLQQPWAVTAPVSFALPAGTVSRTADDQARARAIAARVDGSHRRA
jgi:hypothetical protein